MAVGSSDSSFVMNVQATLGSACCHVSDGRGVNQSLNQSINQPTSTCLAIGQLSGQAKAAMRCFRVSDD